jgi:hypothetical protein
MLMNRTYRMPGMCRPLPTRIVPSIPSHLPSPTRPNPPRQGTFRERIKTDIAIESAVSPSPKWKIIAWMEPRRPPTRRCTALRATPLFPQYAVKMQSPVSFPFIWNVPDNVGRKPAEFQWIHL